MYKQAISYIRRILFTMNTEKTEHSKSGKVVCASDSPCLKMYFPIFSFSNAPMCGAGESFEISKTSFGAGHSSVPIAPIWLKFLQ